MRKGNSCSLSRRSCFPRQRGRSKEPFLFDIQRPFESQDVWRRGLGFFLPDSFLDPSTPLKPRPSIFPLDNTRGGELVEPLGAVMLSKGSGSTLSMPRAETRGAEGLTPQIGALISYPGDLKEFRGPANVRECPGHTDCFVRSVFCAPSILRKTLFGRSSSCGCESKDTCPPTGESKGGCNGCT